MEVCITIIQHPSGINFKYSEWDGRLNLKYSEGNLTLALLILHLPKCLTELLFQPCIFIWTGFYWRNTIT